MKMPIGFGNRFFFRVVFPGSVLSGSLLLLTYSILFTYNLSAYVSHIFILQIFAFGWIFVVLDMPIYMLFEGRRYWPRCLADLFRRRQRGRLALLHRKMRAKNSALLKRDKVDFRRAYLEAAAELGNFPIDPLTSMQTVQWPTRLGNLIAAFEQYPRMKYGMDAVFYWPRIWVSIDQTLRDEIDGQQAQVDGLLYLSVALCVSSILFVLYGIIDIYEPSYLAISLPTWMYFFLAVVVVLFSRIVYISSLFSHAQFGDIFKSTFDQYRQRVSVDDTVSMIADITNDPRLISKIASDNYISAWRFLRWHRVRLTGATTNRRIRLP